MSTYTLDELKVIKEAVEEDLDSIEVELPKMERDGEPYSLKDELTEELAIINGIIDTREADAYAANQTG